MFFFLPFVAGKGIQINARTDTTGEFQAYLKGVSWH